MVKGWGKSLKPKVFLEFVEIKSLIASVLPFVLGSMYAYYNYHQLHLGYLLLFFIASSLFHMATNANDNYQDFLHAPRNDLISTNSRNTFGFNDLHHPFV
ncbi:hypothetical protein WP50_36055 [Lactiplantibacillus plantarum]|nr:hypothetical protein WP50_36055 [Lactiplantibacillus plantarum]